MKLKDISRTATFAWDPASGSIATGAVAGALDESFSNESQLEIWSPRFYDKDGSDAQGFQLGEKGKAGPEGSVNVASRFNRLAWSQPGATASGRGMIAAGMETGELFLYDPVKILEGADAQVFKSDKHTGPVRGLDFNPIQKNLLLSGAINAELFIYDLNNPGTPLPPGPLSTKLNEITALQWNTTVSRVFAASSSSGYTSVWDLRASKEIVSLQYGGGAAKGDMSGYSAGLQMGKRRGMSDVCWHPEQATRLITASEDDESPIIMLWDLRNTRAPERILSGHSKGVLSVAWCQQDPDLLASCGKDNRTLLWNPQTGDMVGELPRTSDWAFEVKWDPRNPNFLGTASFDGHIGIHSLQATQVEEDKTPALPESANADDIFSALGQSDQNDSKANVQSLTVAPKWMRRPVSATFGYGGLLTTVSNLPVGAAKPQTSTVNLRTVVTEEALLDRAKELDEIASDKSKLSEFSSNRDGAAWKALRTLFQANTRDELVALLGFSKEEVAQKVQEVVKKLAPELEAKNDKDKTPEPATKGDETPKTDKPATEIPSITTSSSEASALFGDDRPFTPAEAGGEADFFASMASGSLRNPQLDAIVPHTNAAADSSVAATIGSGASSLRSEVIGRDNNFSIYPPGESDTDKLITQALVLGDFKSAVDLCVASDRFADALLLAVRGGQELLEATQKAYFTRRTMEHPFLRIFQSIVTEDLADIVQNADLAEWRVVFVVLCTFAKDADFANLADQLGQRLQFKWQLLAASDSPEAKESARTARQDATLCYLAARNLERIVSIWVSEMQEEEEQSNGPLYSAHAKALQSFIEKVTVFRVATGYVDKDLQSTTPSADSGARTYGLAGLYDRFYEYADLLATQGLVDIAAKYVQMTPAGYVGSSAVQNLDKARQRLLTAAGVSSTAAASSSGIGKPATANKQATAGRPGHSYNASYGGGYNVPYQQTQPGPYGAPASQQNQPFARPPSASATRGYGQPPAPTSGPYAPPPSTQTAGPYAPPPSKQPQQQQQSAPGPYGPPPTQQQPQQQQQQPGPFGGPPKPGAYAPQSQPGQQSRPGPYGAPAQQQSYGAPSQPGPYAPAQSSSYAPPAQQNAYGPNGAFPGVQSQGYGGQQQTSAYQPQFPAGNLPPPPRANESQSSAPPVVPASQRRDLPGWNDAPSLATKRPSSATRESTPKPAAIVSPFPMGEQPAHMGGAYPPGPGGPPPPGPAGAALPPPPRGGPRPPSTGPQYAQPPPPGQHAFSPPPQARPPPQGGPRAGPPPPSAAGGPPPRARSPLSPGGARSAQQFGAFSPPPPQGRPLAGPPPPGSRLAGPPPPSHHAAAPMPGQSPPQAASPPAQPAPPPAPAKHPAGDRSHLSASGRPVYEGLSKELQRIKDTNPPARLTKIVNDTERRLNILFDDLNNDDIGDETVSQLGQIVQAINARDANSALAMHVDLLTTATGNTVHWAPGIKQLIRLGI